MIDDDDNDDDVMMMMMMMSDGRTWVGKETYLRASYCAQLLRMFDSDEGAYWGSAKAGLGEGGGRKELCQSSKGTRCESDEGA
jgi:hypothetical protein